MEKCFCFGLAMGMVVGALLAVNSCKIRKLVVEGQKQVKEEVQKVTDKCEKMQNESEE